MTGVLIVDDQDLLRAGFAALLRATPGIDVVGEAANGREAVALAKELRPDVVLMDLRLPELDGVGATERILAEAEPPRPGILVLTVFDLDDYVYSALRAGASGFLLKDSPPETLITGVRTVADGGMLFGPTITRRLVETYMRVPPPNSGIPSQLSTLTRRELDVLRLIATGATNAEIAEHLVVSEGTVKTHVNRAMTKLGVSSRAQAVVIAYESGLVVPRGSG
ncbi:response regulator transcription factor [Saccharopolyspora gloriosae]|uniref:DNA-binding NarL/FixJ family response regulator n=1 Tax=Saccharopolyspora gloriosae TaxID=455344 RepID=A0A840NJW0_9PSEU|nr:response regulator transcription factor [Saccharopolyspora gloriosae]MBB5071351.1 DNA-binding NarL/FixJ family response regulator [Saccharopolyspora gloriosae]